MPGVSGEAFPLIAAVDWFTTLAPEGNTSVTTRESNLCGVGPFIVISHRKPQTTVTIPGGGTTTVAGNAVESGDVGFTFIVP